MFKLYMVLSYTFFKIYISKICNGFSLYTNAHAHIRALTHTHIYVLEFHWF